MTSTQKDRSLESYPFLLLVIQARPTSDLELNALLPQKPHQFQKNCEKKDNACWYNALLKEIVFYWQSDLSIQNFIWLDNYIKVALTAGLSTTCPLLSVQVSHVCTQGNECNSTTQTHFKPHKKSPIEMLNRKTFEIEKNRRNFE